MLYIKLIFNYMTHFKLYSASWTEHLPLFVACLGP